jgi:hypothetical protein
MSAILWIMLVALLVIAGVTTLALFKAPMRRPESSLHDREQWFAQARTMRGETPRDGEPTWDGKARRPNLEGESGAGLV